MIRFVANFVFLVILSLSGCRDLLQDTTEFSQILSHKQASIRSKQVQNVHYNLQINLMDPKEFRGLVEMEFDLVQMDSPLRVDFANGKIQSILINQKPVPSVGYNSGFFMVSTNLLDPGTNKIQIEYSHPYSRSGNGLHRFEDPKDGRTYLYTQFETNHAKALFPCFDQPDIKATYKLEVTHPKDWVVISSTIPVVKSRDSTSNLSIFPRSSIFSTYVLSLHAGPYYVWTDSYKNIPLKLYSRQSMKDYVNSKFWFRITKEGFGYFEKYFAIPYPFGKYDQIIVPEFNFGAMENVGAVTYSERYLSRGQVTRSMREKLASVILHEMAHMWFGNLVTMTWWDGLWLNESFATYMSYKALFEATEFQEAWETFFVEMKSWAYREDKSSTTHPIQGKVENTEEAFTHFDGITYGKGAAVLKQLEFYIGESAFREGVSFYLKNFSHSNANLKDFLESLESASGKDLKPWSREWLESEGFNRIMVTHSCSEDGLFLKEITIHQDHVANTKILRTHRTEVAAYKISPKGIRFLGSQKIEYKGGKTKFPWQSQNTECPDFIYPNHGDHDYVRVDFPQDLLDERGLVRIRSILKTEDSLTSLILWRELNEEFREGDLSLIQYADLAMDLLQEESRDIIIESNLERITGTEFPSYNAFLYLYKEEEKKRLISELEDWTWENMTTSQPYSDKKKTWFRAYLSVGYTNQFKERMVGLINSKTDQIALKIDQDLRWAILIKLCSLESDKTSIQSLIQRELQTDNTKFGKDSALACEAAIADPVTKGKWMQELLKPNVEYSASTLRTVMYHIFPINQMVLQIPFVEFYYQNIRDSKIEGDENYLDSYTRLLSPRFCTEENRLILKKFISRHRNLPASVSKTLRTVLESEEECLRIRHRAQI